MVDAQITFVTDTTGLATELILRQGARTNTRESKGRLNLDRDCDRHKEFFWRHRIVRHSDILEAAFVLSSRRVARRNERENMIIGDRLRALREQENLSQGDIEKRTGLLRGYISRVENGHTVPAIETLEKLARAMDTPLYQLFYEPGEPSAMSSLGKDGWGSTRKEARLLAQFRGLLSRIRQDDRELLLFMAQTMTRTSKKRARPSRSA